MNERPFGDVEVCPTCLCLDVQAEDWVSIKTQQPSGDGSGGTIYCEGCAFVAEDGLHRCTEMRDRGAVGVWEIPPVEWFDDDDAHYEQVARLHAFGRETAERGEVA